MDRPLTVRTYLDFEKPIAELESKVAELSALSVDDDGSVSITEEVTKLQQKAHQALVDTYAKLTPWQKTQVARHPDRPHCLDYVKALIEDFTPLAGDRYYAEDAAIMGGIGRFRGRSVMVIGHEKGSDTESRIRHNFGMARPEGYRKAVRLMDLAERFGMPVVTLVDTAGAYPGIGAEERGQAEAIARSTDRCLSLGVPLVAVIIGEGGSGGAVAIATANRVMMLEHAIYTVASPEAAASILWRDPARAIDAATSMKITAQDLKSLGVIDVIITEPVGGAHRDTAMIFKQTAGAIAGALTEFSGMSADGIREQRQEKFLQIGRSL
jgi:acetyl-CoA carboxylase carboxyl transferase subunit alpha